MGLKCVVSDYALAHWYAQTFKLDINNLPSNAGRDNSAIGQACTFLRRYKGKRKMVEVEIEDHIKKLRDKGSQQPVHELDAMISDQFDKNEKITGAEAMQRMAPLVYPINREVIHFQEFHTAQGAYVDKKGYKKESTMIKRHDKKDKEGLSIFR